MRESELEKREQWTERSQKRRKEHAHPHTHPSKGLTLEAVARPGGALAGGGAVGHGVAAGTVAHSSSLQTRLARVWGGYDQGSWSGAQEQGAGGESGVGDKIAAMCVILAY